MEILLLGFRMISYENCNYVYLYSTLLIGSIYHLLPFDFITDGFYRFSVDPFNSFHIYIAE